MSKIIVEVVLKIYGENPPRGDYHLQYMCGIRVIFSTLQVLISLKDASLMIASVKCLKKICGGLPIAMQTYTIPEKFPCNLF